MLDARGVSIAELSRVSGVSLPTLFRWQRGAVVRPSRPALAAVAEALDVTEDGLRAAIARSA